MFLDWLEHHLLPCPTKYFFGIDCPGCGMQRAIIALLKGNFMESLQLYPPLIPLIILLIVLIVNLCVNSKNWLKILKIIFIFDVLLILLNYILKFI